MTRLFEVLDRFSRDDLTVVAVTLMVIATLAGHIMDAALGPRGFGSYGNALLILLSTFAVLAWALLNWGEIYEADMARVAFYCAAASLVSIVSLGILKGRLVRD